MPITRFTRKQLDRLGPRLRLGFQFATRWPVDLNPVKGDLVLVAKGRYLDLYLVIDRAGQTRQRKVNFKPGVAR